MVTKGSVPKDLFMNLADVRATLDGADSSVLVKGELPTGLSVRGERIWLVHGVEIVHGVPDLAAVELMLGVSTEKGRATLPSYINKGTLQYYAMTALLVVGAGAASVAVLPFIRSFLPPVPIAAPQLVVYAQTTADEALMRGTHVDVRILYTTAPLDAAAYTEIAETWGW